MDLRRVKKGGSGREIEKAREGACSVRIGRRGFHACVALERVWEKEECVKQRLGTN